MQTSFSQHARIAWILLLVGGAYVSSAAAASPTRPNFLFISVDDLRPELGCYGAEHIKSPNIDRLASSGITFDRCYVQVAVCNPSRASTFTGIRPDRLGVWTLPVHFREAMPEAVTLPQYLGQHGYKCEGFGKIFHNPWQDPRSWTTPHHFGKGSFTNYSDQQKEFTQQVEEMLSTDDWRKGNLRGPITNDPVIEDEDHPDGEMTQQVVHRLAQLSEREEPFFLAVGYILPHLPWCPPKHWWDQYDRDQIPLADNTVPTKDAPAIALGTNYELSHYSDMTNMPTPLEAGVSDDQARRFRHAYFASVSFVDAQIGKLLNALKTNHLDENTVVVLWSDHGWKLGEHNAWGKMTNFEIDTRIPLIIFDPHAKANGQRCQQIMESLDLYPTICELASIPVPADVDGKSVKHLLEDPSAPHIDAAFSQYTRKGLMGNAIRTDRWRYVEWRTMNEGTTIHRELYDHQADPAENANVAEQHPEVIERLAKQLRKVLAPHPISLVPQIHSDKGGQKVKVRWVNEYDGEVRVTWISPKGERKVRLDLKRGQTKNQNSFIGHRFSIESEDGKYHEIVEVQEDDHVITLDG